MLICLNGAEPAEDGSFVVQCPASYESAVLVADESERICGLPTAFKACFILVRTRVKEVNWDTDRLDIIMSI